jgi:hypothetical protein
VDILVSNGIQDPEAVHKIALVSQGKMTTTYAKEFARGPPAGAVEANDYLMPAPLTSEPLPIVSRY